MKKEKNDGRNRFPVKSGAVSISVSQYKDGRFFFRRKTSRGWKTVVRVDRADIEREAKETAKLIADQKAAVMGLHPSEVQEFLKWKAEQGRAILVSSALKEYIDIKSASGLSEYHLRSITGLKKILGPLEDMNIRKVTSEQIAAAIPSQYYVGTELKKISSRRRNNILDTITTFFRWCKKKGMLPDGMTAPERIDRHQESAPTKDFFTLEEFTNIEMQVSDTWRPWLAIACFSGIRTEELSKLNWDDIVLTRSVINVRAEISKTGHRRLVPIQPNLKAFLELYGKRRGKICPTRLDNYIRKIEGWKKNGPRHSYGSYRLAVIQNAPQLAEEMGNSVPMIRKHYAEAVLPAEGIAWFARRLSRPENIMDIKTA